MACKKVREIQHCEKKDMDTCAILCPYLGRCRHKHSVESSIMYGWWTYKVKDYSLAFGIKSALLKNRVVVPGRGSAYAYKIKEWRCFSSSKGTLLFPFITLPMALAQDCSSSGPSVPSCCIRSQLRYRSKVKGNLVKANKGVRQNKTTFWKHCVGGKGFNPFPCAICPISSPILNCPEDSAATVSKWLLQHPVSPKQLPPTFPFLRVKEVAL